MPTKTPPKPAVKKKKKPARAIDTAERMRRASRPNPRSKKTTEQRMREATGARHKPTRRRAKMTNGEQQGQGQQKPPQQQPRGAGSGEKANETRQQNLVDWPPPAVPHAEAVDALEQEAQAQADHNAKMHEAQVENAAAFTEKMVDMANPKSDADKAREEAEQAYLTSTDPKKKMERLKGEMDARAKRDRAQVEAQQGRK